MNWYFCHIVWSKLKSTNNLLSFVTLKTDEILTWLCIQNMYAIQPLFWMYYSKMFSVMPIKQRFKWLCTNIAYYKIIYEKSKLYFKVQKYYIKVLQVKKLGNGYFLPLHENAVFWFPLNLSCITKNLQTQIQILM